MIRSANSTELNLKRLALFRILFGLAMTIHVFDLWNSGALRYFFIDPAFHFKYPWLHGLPMPNETIVMGSFLAVGIFGLVLAAGLWARMAATVMVIIYGYFLLTDASFFKHHHYLFLLIAGLMTVVKTDHKWSITSHDNIADEGHIALGLLMLRLQMVVPYFFGGVSKFINADWRSGETASMILTANFPDTPGLLVLAPLMTWGGLLFDITIGFLLFVPKIRSFVFVAALIFNLANYMLFNIDVFPLVMLGGCILFAGTVQGDKKGHISMTWLHSAFVVRAIAGFYLFIQLILPLRHFIISGDVFWTGEGYMMGWNMIDSLKRNSISFIVSDHNNKLRYELAAEDHLTARQRGTLARFPEFAPQAARHIASKATLWNIEHPEVAVVIEVSKNGRPFLPVTYADLNLTESRSKVLQHDKWIIATEQAAKTQKGGQ